MATLKQNTKTVHTLTGVLVEINEANLPYTNPVAVVGNGVTGSAVLKRTTGGLVAESMTLNGKLDLSLTPAIKVQVTKKEFDLSGKETSREGKIVGIELNPKPNVDPRIKSLAEQIKG